MKGWLSVSITTWGARAQYNLRPTFLRFKAKFWAGIAHLPLAQVNYICDVRKLANACYILSMPASQNIQIQADTSLQTMHIVSCVEPLSILGSSQTSSHHQGHHPVLSSCSDELLPNSQHPAALSTQQADYSYRGLYPTVGQPLRFTPEPSWVQRSDLDHRPSHSDQDQLPSQTLRFILCRLWSC